ncbi:MAG: ATP-binding protein [Rhodothermaceae bacterium]
MVKKLITQVFEKAKEELLDENLYINEEINFNAYSFIVWSNSVLHKNSMSSKVAFYNKNKSLMGDFRYKYDFPSKDTLRMRSFSFRNGEIRFDEPSRRNRKVIRGVMPIYHENDVEGYLVIKVNYGLAKTIFKRAPRFLSDLKSTYKSPVNLRELKIFAFEDKKLKNVFGDIYPGLTVQKEILSLDFSKDKSIWRNLEFGGSSYNTYILKYGEANEDKILVLALLKKGLTRNIFDFFKIFFVHTFFIFVIVLLMLLINIKQGRSYKYSFKTQLLISFLVISIIPLIFLAVYFRDLQDEKNTSAIFYKLKKRAVSVENFINAKLEVSEKSLKEISDMASTDLGIEFNVYEEDHLVYTSYPEYFQTGLFPDKLNPVAFKKLVLEGYNEFVNIEKVDDMEYNSFYYYGNIGGTYYILKVNDILNTYLIPMSGTEIDIFLFGSYSFAAILIVIFSTIIANQISQPIRKLTEATKSVAGGDLDLELYQYSRGEVKELVDGFNTMIKDLRQSRQELAEVERETAWKEMARQVAHEIKNPLTPMKLAVQQLVIARKDKSPKFEDIFNKVTKTFDQQIDTLRNIADEFSNFARMPEPNREKIDIVKIANDAANLYVDDRAEVNVVTELDKCFITGDEDQLKRTMINMVRNSIQASSTQIKIEVLQNDKSCIKISDNGNGIPDNIRKKIFDANFTTKVEGMGLGLNMAKRFINKIGGEIKIEKSDNSGTIFIIKFPKVN